MPVRPLIEVAANRRLYNLSKIEKEHEQRNLLPKDRVDRRTSKLAKSASKMVPDGANLSPKKIDHLIRAYTGGMGSDVLEVLESAGSLADGDLDVKLERIPILSRVIKTQGFYSGISIRKFFEELQYLRQKKGSGAATDQEKGLLRMMTHLHQGTADKPGMKDLKKALDAGVFTLKRAKELRDKHFLAVWERAKKRLAERKK